MSRLARAVGCVPRPSATRCTARSAGRGDRHCQVADQSAFLSLGAERPRPVSRHTSPHPRDETSGLSRDGGELPGAGGGRP